MNQKGILRAEAMVAWKKKAGMLQVPIVPKHIIMCPQDVLPTKYRSLLSKEIKGLMGRHLCVDPANGVYLSAGWGVGAPALVAVCEELRALGAARFTLVGLCGRLSDEHDEGEVVYAASALREEGTSHHYLEDGAAKKLSCNSDRLMTIADQLKYTQGNFVSTDAPYRETPDRVDAWKAASCTIIDMETAALYAFAAHYSLEAISIGVGADSLANDTWSQPQQYSRLHEVLKKTVSQLTGMHS